MNLELNNVSERRALALLGELCDFDSLSFERFLQDVKEVRSLCFIDQWTPEEIAESFPDVISLVAFTTPRTIAQGYAMFAQSEFLRSGLTLPQVNDATLRNIRLLMEQSQLDSPNLALCSNLAAKIADGLETATGNGEGAALKRLAAFETTAGVRKSVTRGDVA